MSIALSVAVAATLAALLSLLSFVAPDLLGPALALSVVATVCRLGTLLLLRRAAARRHAAESAPESGGSNTEDGAGALNGLRLLFLGEALFAAAKVAGLPVEPHVESAASVWTGWAGLVAWLAYGAAGVWGGLKLLAATGWLRAGGILIAIAAGLWFTQIGLVLWPFAIAAGYGCFALAGMKLRLEAIN